MAAQPADVQAKTFGGTLAGLPAGHVLVPLIEELLNEMRALKAQVASLVTVGPQAAPGATKAAAPQMMPLSVADAPASLVQPRVTKDSRIRIAIVGPDAQQANHIREKVGERAIVTILDRASVGRKLPSSDFIILTRHVGHEWWEKAKATVGQPNVVRIATGGIETVVQKVYDLASRQRAAQ